MPLYVVLGLMLVAAIWWYEHKPEVVAEINPLKNAMPPVKVMNTKQRRFWAFLPPVSFIGFNGG